MALSDKPACIITDYAVIYSASETEAPQVNMPVVATASVNPAPLFVQQLDGSWAVMEAPAETVLTSDGLTNTAPAGQWTLALPAQPDCTPDTVTWTITTPGGTQYSGNVTAAMVTASQTVPLTVHDLVTTYAWTHTP